MTYLRISDDFYRLEKVRRLTPQAGWLLVLIWDYCAERLNDGVLTEAQVQDLGRMHPRLRGLGKLTDELVATGFLEVRLQQGGNKEYTSPQYLDQNWTAEKRRQHLAENKERVRKHRQKEIEDAARNGPSNALQGPRLDRSDLPVRNALRNVLPTGTGTGNDSIEGDGVPAPQEGEGPESSPLTESPGSSPKLSWRAVHRSDIVLIDAELALAKRQEARKRKDLLARAKMRDLASHSPLRVKGLPPHVTQ